MDNEQMTELVKECYDIAYNGIMKSKISKIKATPSRDKYIIEKTAITILISELGVLPQAPAGEGQKRATAKQHNQIMKYLTDRNMPVKTKKWLSSKLKENKTTIISKVVVAEAQTEIEANSIIDIFRAFIEAETPEPFASTKKTTKKGGKKKIPKLEL